MLLEPLATAGVENLLNTFLHRSSTLKSIRARLQGKVPRVNLKGFSIPLVLVSNERQIDALGTWESEADYTVITYVSVLPKLCDRQQLTTLICSGELEVQGDIQVVQNFVAPADPAELGPAELLAPYIGDIVAEGVSKALRGGAKFLCYNFQRQQRYVAGAVTEEWHMIPGPLEIVWSTEETVAVEHTVESLTKRPEKLEAR